MDHKIVVIAGATGQLGGLIARDLISREGIGVRALVRPGSAAKAEGLAALGVEVVEVALDGTGDPKVLNRAMQGAFAVVSALQGGPEILVDAQSRLLEAALAGGVRRFIPSDFAVDFTRLPQGANRNFDIRLDFHAAADAIVARSGSTIEFTSIYQGAFTELLESGWMLLNFKKRQVQYFGSADTQMDFTTWEDTAAFTAAVAIDDTATPKSLRISGARITPAQLQQITKQVTGVDFHLKRVMSVGMLRTMIGIMKFFKPGRPGDLMPIWVGMQYAYSMALGTGVGPLDNDRYPQLTWTGVEDVVRGAVAAHPAV
jgi:hypothetical protein